MAQSFENFISASKNKLMDGENVFRFISFNVPNLNYIEDEMAFTSLHPYRLPNAFEIRDAFESVKQLGGNVIRIYTIPVLDQNNPPDVPTYVLGPGQFNEAAFKVTDLMLSIANETGIRIIFPLVNNWSWLGGRPQYAAFRNKRKGKFWTDPQLINDFKFTIQHVLNRTNTITGIKYKNDKAILCWETGNELTSPRRWTVEIANYIKSLDPNHLLLDGFFAINIKPVRRASIKASGIDIISMHHYEKKIFWLFKNVKRNLKIIKNQKPAIIGEFGFLSTIATEKVLDMVIAEESISGALLWSLRFHRREGGFYWHSEPAGRGLYKAYHWPGFPSGSAYDETGLLEMVREKAFKIRGMTPPTLPVPTSPALLPIQHISKISWQGSTGASHYDLKRADTLDGPWAIVGENISDAALPYKALFHDISAQIGQQYYYRVIAKNKSGQSSPSNIEGPIKVNDQVLIDEMINLEKISDQQGIQLINGADRKFKEDPHRIQGKNKSQLTYAAPGKIKKCLIYSFEKQKENALIVEAILEGNDSKSLKANTKSFYTGKGAYNYWIPKLYQIEAPNQEIEFLKIRFSGKAQISRIEIYYQ